MVRRPAGRRGGFRRRTGRQILPGRTYLAPGPVNGVLTTGIYCSGRNIPTSREKVQVGMAATATVDNVETGDSSAEAGLPRRRLAGKKLVLFILLPLLLIGGVGGGLVGTGVIGRPGEGGAAGDASEPASFAFFDLPDLLVNLSSTGKRPSFLKIRVSLELASEGDAAALQALTPRIIDNFQVYLRELRTTDLQGSAGMARLREELLRRVNAAVEPIKVRDVLFREMLVQ